MSKPKFKVGDKVRILDGSKIKSYIGGWVDNMKRHIGEIATIKSLCLSHGSQNGYCLKEFTYSWDERGLELVKPEKIIIYRNGAEVVAKNTATGETGVAKCNPADEFDFNTGAKLAFERLINPEPEKPKYYTGKVVCVASPDEDFTVGKIYTFENGKTQDNEGDYRPVGYHLKEFEDGCCFTNTYKFIPLIED